MPRQIITRAMLKRAVLSTTDFDSFVQAIVQTVISRAFDFGGVFSPDDCETLANLLFEEYGNHYRELTEIYRK